MRNAWTKEKIDSLRSLALTHTREQASEILGVTYDAASKAASRYGIAFARGRFKAKGKHAMSIMAVRVSELAPTRSYSQIAKDLGLSRNSVAGLCNRNGIRTFLASPPKRTAEERRQHRTEEERARRDRNRAIGLTSDGKTRKGRNGWKGTIAFTKRRMTRFQLLCPYGVVPSLRDRKIVEMESSARRVEQDRKMSTMEVCKLFASGQIDRAEMSRRLEQPQQRAAA